MKTVRFITCESGDDLIVSFAVAGVDAHDVLSLTLIRTPKYEQFLYDYERGIHVSFEDDDDDEDHVELLLSFEGDASQIKLITTERDFLLDISSVDKSDLKEMREVLKKMNFDKKVKIHYA